MFVGDKDIDMIRKKYTEVGKEAYYNNYKQLFLDTFNEGIIHYL